MSGRRVLRKGQERFEVAVERPFSSEAELHQAVAAHPEVLPSEDVGLGVLVPLASELDLGAGPLDLLAVDPSGQVVLVEFKKDSASTHVRRVVAQMLDYGSALWRTQVRELEDQCRGCEPGFDGALEDHVGEWLEHLETGESFDPGAFLSGLESTLDNGDFHFLYVVKDLDSKTRRVMNFLSEGPQMSFFAVEVDLFDFGDDAVFVPRTAFVPSWAAGGAPKRGQATAKSVAELLAEADDDVREFDRLLTAIVDELGAMVEDTARSRNYRPTRGRYGISLLPHYRKVHIYLGSFRHRGEDELADRFADVLRSVHPDKEPAEVEPGVPVEALMSDWPRVEVELLRPYLEGRLRHMRQED